MDVTAHQPDSDREYGCKTGPEEDGGSDKFRSADAAIRDRMWVVKEPGPPPRDAFVSPLARVNLALPLNAGEYMLYETQCYTPAVLNLFCLGTGLALSLLERLHPRDHAKHTREVVSNGS